MASTMNSDRGPLFRPTVPSTSIGIPRIVDSKAVAFMPSGNIKTIMINMPAPKTPSITFLSLNVPPQIVPSSAYGSGII
jgi:hypothetical protein